MNTPSIPGGGQTRRSARRNLTLASILVAAVSSPLALAQHDSGTPVAELAPSLYPGAAYSPYAQRNFPSNVY